MKPCPQCNTAPGELHAPGCDVERCPECGCQTISCDCPALAYTQEADRMPWTGEWPGVVECREYGLWSKWSERQGWVTCDISDPEAREDLNRLRIRCDWDKTKRRWVLR